MKTKITIIALILILAACSKKDADDKAAASTSADNAATTSAPAEAAKPDAPAAESAKPVEAPTDAAPNLTAELDWNTVPDLKDIGNFPFLTAPEGLKINNEKDGLTKLFDFETLESYTENGVLSTQGKLGFLHFRDEKEKPYNQSLFENSFYSYLEKLGAKQLFRGTLPEINSNNQYQLKKLEKNSNLGGNYYSHGNYPTTIYAFKNGDKNYVVNIQSNASEGNVYIMELKAFEQTMKKYTAEAMKTEIDATGKAILNINFDTDKATLKADGVDVVNQISALLKNNADLKLSIEGHTDNTGAAERNKVLSNERANAVMQALVMAGANKANLKAAGFGADKPLVANDTDDNKAKNRRVELVKF